HTILKHGIKIISNQVQYSLIDLRPAVKMAQFCKDNNIWLFAYGTLCGGLLSEKYLGQSEPSHLEINTASLRKYKQMIDVWGGWNLFQDLLYTLSTIAQKHSVSIANVAVRYILDCSAVAGVIIGTRLSIAQHIADNIRVFNLSLDNDDLAEINSVLVRSRDLFSLIGDCGDEYRH
ncbi:MAG: aldo/keto reductase, partial [Acidobacteriota bacterium]